MRDDLQEILSVFAAAVRALLQDKDLAYADPAERALVARIRDLLHGNMPGRRSIWNGIAPRTRSETIRQNSVFKDYLLLAEHPTAKRKHLYLLGTEHAIRFLRGGRAMSSVLSRNTKLQRMFTERFGERFRTVCDYYAAHASAVQIDDVSPWLSELAGDDLFNTKAV